jgi:hypothetical protein
MPALSTKLSRAGNMPGSPPPPTLRLLTGRTGFTRRKRTVVTDTLVANMPKRTKKLLVYLDQNFISEMAKADVNVKVKQEWKDLFSLLKEGFLGEKLVVPQSWFHDVETSFAPVLKKRIVSYQNYLGQVDLHRAPDVRINQTARLLERFLGKSDQDPLGTERATAPKRTRILLGLGRNHRHRTLGRAGPMPRPRSKRTRARGDR